MRSVIPLLIVACAKPSAPEAVPRALADFSAPADARSFYAQALYAAAHGDDARAQHAIDWVVRLDRPNPWMWLASARFAEARGDADRAIADATAALERAPDFAEAHLLLGRVLRSVGRVDEAAAHLAAAPPCAVAALLADETTPALRVVGDDARSSCAPAEDASKGAGGGGP